LAGGLLLPDSPGLLDPCEREPRDAAENLTPQQREEITSYAQTSLRQIAFREIHHVLNMEPIPPPRHGVHPGQPGGFGGGGGNFRSHSEVQSNRKRKAESDVASDTTEVTQAITDTSPAPPPAKKEAV